MSRPRRSLAILYGSRALGRHRPASDIDLTLIGPAISAASLAHIKRSGVELYRRPDASDSPHGYLFPPLQLSLRGG